MGDLESLLLVVAAIYLTECTVWVRRGGVAVCSYWGQTWRLWHPGTIMGNARGAVLLANPLPPFGIVFVSHQFPFSLSTQAMFSFTAASINPDWRPSQLARCVRYEDTRTISVEGRNIQVNGELFLKAPSTAAARRLAVLLRHLKLLPEGERAVAICTALAKAFDTEKVQTRWHEFRAQSKSLHLFSTILFWYVFVVAPVLLWYFGFRDAGLGVAAGLLVQTFTIGWLFRRAHQTLFPDGAEERFVPFLTMLLAAPTAIRAPDLLARHLMEDFHPLAVVQAFCPAEKFRSLARHALMDLHFPMLPVFPSSEPEVVQTVEWFHRVLLDETEKALVRAGLKPAELLAPPSRTEAVHRAYCPRCGAQFVSVDAVCEDCGGRPLVAFEEVAGVSRPDDGA